MGGTINRCWCCVARLLGETKTSPHSLFKDVVICFSCCIVINLCGEWSDAMVLMWFLCFYFANACV
jgi:hypothetical protein